MFNPTHISSSAPTVNDDFSAGFRNGVFWWDTATRKWYLLEDDAEGAADWKEVSGGAITDWDDWTPTYTWGGGTPTVTLTIGRYILLGKICYFTLQVEATTGLAATTDMSCTLPAYASVVDNNSLVPIDNIIWIDGGGFTRSVYSSINSVSDPAKLGHSCWVSVGASTDFKLFYSGSYEIQ